MAFCFIICIFVPEMMITIKTNKVMKKEVLVFNIYWDETDWDETDAEVIEHYESLPKEVTLSLDEVSMESIEDTLCDMYGWAVSNFDYQ